MIKPFRFITIRFGSISVYLISLVIVLSGCGSAQSSSSNEDILQNAAGTATAMIQSANATAIVIKAQAMATSIVANANVPSIVSSPIFPYTQTSDGVVISETPQSSETVKESSSEDNLISTEQTTSMTVELVDVTTAADGGLIMVQYRSPARLAESWRQGNVSVTDESTGNVYAEIPSLGSIGPLFARPKVDGRLAYFMLINAPIPLKTGALVKVIMGEYQWEHIPVQ